MESNNVAMWLYVGVSLITIGVLLYFLIRCEHKNRDGYCLCTGMGGQHCQPNMTKSYDEGVNESNIPVITKGWNQPSPGDLAFVNRNNCSANPEYDLMKHVL